ncbi:hypothetical protein WEH80_02865 [Actinomycetes bacterium KLBMP 9759]
MAKGDGYCAPPPVTRVPSGSDVTRVPSGVEVTLVPSGSDVTRVPSGVEVTLVPSGTDVTRVPSVSSAAAVPAPIASPQATSTVATVPRVKRFMFSPECCAEFIANAAEHGVHPGSNESWIYTHNRML